MGRSKTERSHTLKPADRQKLEHLRQVTGKRITLKEWESIEQMHIQDAMAMVLIDTFEVKVLVREDRYLKHGRRVLVFMRNQATGGWYLDSDSTAWHDDGFVPYVYEKSGRRQTADELQEQREWEKLCYRPGTGRTPLDSYDRVNDPLIRSTEKMERYY
jgi:hypothetical protein